MVDRLREELTPHKDFRGYVGMSGIGGCLYDLYMRAKHAIPPDDRLKWYGYTGQFHEAAVKRLLGLERDAVLTFLGNPDPAHEIVADFDARYRGHYDAALSGTSEGTLVEIKSVNWKRFRQVKVGGWPRTHIAQVQAYMRHGPFDHAILVYICRDMPHKQLFQPAPPLWCVDVYKDDGHGKELDERAIEVLGALDDERDPPHCDCGWCGRNWEGVESC
jgi:hypothetical protein